MSWAKVPENTALFPPQQARLRLPRVPGTLPSFPLMACGEKPRTNGTLSPGSSAVDSGLNSSLTWYRRLPGSNRHHRLEPLREENKTSPVNERTAPGPSGSTKLNPVGTLVEMKGASGTKTRGKNSPRGRPEDRINGKKENGETARRRPKDARPSEEISSRKQRMSYPPCVGPTQRAEWAGLTAVKETKSCPVLSDLENLSITPVKTVSSTDMTQKCPQPSEKGLNRLGTTHQHRNKQESAKRHVEHDRLRVPDATHGRSRHRRSRNTREDSRTQRPKPPSWQDLPHEQTSSGASTNQESVVTHTYAVPESVHSFSGYRCDSATTRSTVDSERRAVRANIKRTRSRVIDSKEIPKAESVLPLSQTKPCEFNLRKTYHDDTVYLLENAQRCRKWLAALEESDVTPHVDESETGEGMDNLNDREETVTCDVEISHDKWNFLGSPYPTSSECSSDEQ